MNPKKEAYPKTAGTIIKWLEKRNMEGYYFETSKEAVDAVLDRIPEGSSISWGGSMTFAESGMKEALYSGNYQIIDRDTATTPGEARNLYAQTILSDYFFMSTNAITLKGELLNIDGRSNRVGPMLHGPSNVIVLAGMNKVVADVESGFKRIRTNACPPNATRLGRNTPCALTGQCGDCLLDDCICSNIVVTRRSTQKNRIKVFLIGEELGY